MKHFKLPDLGEGLQEAEIVEWHVSEGDLIREDDRLLLTLPQVLALTNPVDTDKDQRAEG